MGMTVKVVWESGEPCTGVHVTAWIDGVANEKVSTNSSGEAHFSYGPGQGTIYCDGQKVRSGSLSSYERVTYYKGKGYY